MRRQKLKVDTIKKMQKDIYSMSLVGDCRHITAPGQFINIAIDNFYLRRPISIYSYDTNYLIIVFKTVGGGTHALVGAKTGDVLDVLMPLGNGFDVRRAGKKPLLVGGGIGTPPLYGLAERLVDMGITPEVITGFNGRDDIILTNEFKALGINPIVTTADGSSGIKGLVTDAMDRVDFDYVYACGPEPMLRAVYEKSPDGQFSFEARMACGFGACMGCTCETKYGYKRICKDGPVLYKEEIKW